MTILQTKSMIRCDMRVEMLSYFHQIKGKRQFYKKQGCHGIAWKITTAEDTILEVFSHVCLQNCRRWLMTKYVPLTTLVKCVLRSKGALQKTGGTGQIWEWDWALTNTNQCWLKIKITWGYLSDFTQLSLFFFLTYGGTPQYLEAYCISFSFHFRTRLKKTGM